MNFRTTEILHVLEVYQGIITARPLEMGNREFSQCLISASQSLGSTLLTVPRSTLTSSPELRTIQELIGKQTTANAKSIAAHLLATIADLKRHNGREKNSSRPYFRGTLPQLSGDYTRVTVIFGPALGLGDQITFFQFLQKLVASCPRASFTIYTLYPNLWRHLLPQARELSYRGRPLRPFLQLKLPARQDRPAERELVIFADFECFNFHRKIVPHAPSRDIVEIALGRRTAWLSRGNSPWTRFEEFFSEAVVNNYGILSRMSARFFPNSDEKEIWSPLKTRPENLSGNHNYLVFLNPFSSKQFPFQPDDWRQMLRQIRERLPKHFGMEVVVYPGLDATTRAYVRKICRPVPYEAHMKVRSMEEFDRFNSLTPYSAIPNLIKLLDRVDLCLTVDTFTAHLVPLFAVPTVVITLAENREFWVPGPWSFHCLVSNAARSLPLLAAELLRIQANSRTILPQEVQSANVLLDATAKAARHGINLDAIDEIQNALLNVLHDAPVVQSYQLQARQWLLLWSQLASAMRSEAVDEAGLEPYLYRWKESEFLKLLFLIANSRSAREPEAARLSKAN